MVLLNRLRNYMAVVEVSEGVRLFERNVPTIIDSALSSTTGTDMTLHIWDLGTYVKWFKSNLCKAFLLEKVRS